MTKKFKALRRPQNSAEARLWTEWKRIIGPDRLMPQYWHESLEILYTNAYKRPNNNLRFRQMRLAWLSLGVSPHVAARLMQAGWTRRVSRNGTVSNRPIYSKNDPLKVVLAKADDNVKVQRQIRQFVRNTQDPMWRDKYAGKYWDSIDRTWVP